MQNKWYLESPRYNFVSAKFSFR